MEKLPKYLISLTIHQYLIVNAANYGFRKLPKICIPVMDGVDQPNPSLEWWPDCPTLHLQQEFLKTRPSPGLRQYMCDNVDTRFCGVSVHEITRLC